MAVNKKAIFDLLAKAVIPGECNCYSCRVERLNKLMEAALKAQWPDQTTIPLMCQLNIKRGSVRALPTWANTIPERYKLIIDWMVKIEKQHAKAVAAIPRSALATCACCGMLHHKSSSITFISRDTGEEMTICPSCELYFAICTECHKGDIKGSLLNRLISVRGGGQVCMECFHKLYYQCICCSQTHKKDGKQVDWRKLTGQTYRGEREDLICPKCMEKEVIHCSICDGWMMRHSGYTVERGGAIMCYDCYTLRVQDIQSFDYKPHKFNKLVGKYEMNPPREDALLFGIELEMEPRDVSPYNRNQMARIMLELCGRDKFLVKHDGSVRSGIELVSNPFSWQWLKENKDFMKSIFVKMAKCKYSATHTGNAGFHVHLTKKAFGTFHLYKFLQFYYKASVQTFVKLVSERTTNWRYASFRADDSGNNVKRVAKFKENASQQRHSAISLMYDPTVEVRVFRGVDTMKALMKNLEFIRSTYDFTKDAKVSDLIVGKYIHFIMERRNRNKYPTLIKFLAGNALMKEYYTQSFNYINKNI